MSLIDLHIHTYYSSDGELTPLEIIKLAQKKGIESIAITDHDTIDGLKETLQLGKKKGIEVIPGIEFDTEYAGKSLHILGYYLDWQNTKLKEITENIRDQQLKRAKKRVELLQKMGFSLEWSTVKEKANIIPVGGIIAEVLLTNGLNDNDERLEPYVTGERNDQPYFNFYLDYFLPGQPAYVPIELPNSKEIINLIHELGGVAILAHPGSAIDLSEDEELLTELVESGLDGIEAYSTYHSHDEDLEFVDWAVEKNILITAGSDFHGQLKPKIELGGIQGNNDYKLVKNLKKRAEKY
ncbi:PHP domain-containing protein [Sporohalobacter salinus]|uniref:PHP domain-containing protein n=1 Tax=Sporohalobacter salinus TaxID=1494606 RepID=UPI00195FE676|nr:PHP domain-containing protein [Sporohalobacter salinus]MBM7623114.1 putative metal-dependent phosphoesterase TrpH [Sporohalobacter salinus]